MTKKKFICPLCGGVENVCKRTLSYGPRLFTCSQCDLHFVSPFPPLDQEFYDQNYYRSWGMTNNVLPEHVKFLKENLVFDGSKKDDVFQKLMLTIFSAISTFV